MSDLVERLMASTFVEVMPDGTEVHTGPSGLHIEAAARIRALETGLKPFVDAYLKKRTEYAKRYGADVEIGFKNFDKMPEGWRMEGIIFAMGTLRHAASLLEKKP